jgi:serine/threonine protein kinase
MEIPSANRETVSSDSTYAPTSVIAEHYRVERELGRGGMATVYLCTDLRSESRVAVKVLRQELGSAVVIERFLREIAFASELDHPRIPKVLGSGVIDGLPYYVMTYIEGESLKQRIEREKQLPIADAIKIACDVIAPTAYAHGRGIVHRDLKPDNILIAKDGVYVLDFGIARAIIESGVDRLTSTGIGVGTPAYMSPEQALGDRNLDARSDIYSLGCVMYEMIAGVPPFVGPTAQVIISRRFAAAPPPLSEVRDSVPESIEAAIEKALARSPADRWATVSELGEALRACAKDGSRTSRTPTIKFRRSSLTRAAIGTVIAALVIAGIIAWSRGHRSGFENAQRALGAWDLETAESQLRKAVRSDGNDARSQLWLAQILMLRGAPPAQWKPYSLFAGDHATELTPTERSRAAALISLASGNYPDACKRMAQLVGTESRRDSDFTATLALADCLRKDPTVVTDSTSPSGYRFQSSYHLADSLYEALLERHPNTPAAYAVIMPRLEQVLTIDKSNYRKGDGQGSSRGRFIALPKLVSDTLAHTPYPIAGSGAPWRTRDADAIDAAIARNRQRLRAIARAWSAAAPSDSRPHGVLSRILEANGELTGSATSALEELRRARALTSTTLQEPKERYLTQLRLGIDQVRLYLRLNRFDMVGPLADSLLALQKPDRLDEDSEDAALDLLAPLALLRGRPLQVIQWRQRASGDFLVLLPSGQVATLPAAVSADAFALQEYADAGGPADSILSLADRISGKIAAVVPPAQVEGMRNGALMRPLTLAAPVIGPAPAAKLGPTMDPFVVALRAFAERNIPRTRAALDSLAALHADFAPAEITMDAIYLESWLRAQIGDSARASSQLDMALGGLSAALPSILRSPALAASLVRVMALRAELAAAAKQRDVAIRWANAVIQLWGSGDAITAPTVSRMRSLR